MRRVPAEDRLVSRRVVIAVVLWVLLWVLAALILIAHQAAASLEPPEVGQPTEVKATTAILQGVLDPTSTGEPGSTYQFIYRASSSACKGAGEVKAPIPAGLSLNQEHEPVSQAIEGLHANTHYTVCLAITNSTKTETVVSSLLTFTTALPPEVPQAQKAEPLTATTAKLHGVLNPNAQGNPGSFEFFYRESSSGCQGAGEKVTAGQLATGEKAEPAEAEVSELLPNATYAFCLLARNEAGETALSSPLTFTTLPVKPTLEGESATSISEASAHLSAKVNPNGAAITSCQFEYGTSTEYGHVVPCEHPDAAEVGSGRTPVAVSQTVAYPPSPNITYHWRLTAANAAGSASGPDRTFVDDTAGAALPDNRAYELVTPAQKNEALFGELLFGGVSSPQVAADGQRVIAVSVQCFADSESCKAIRHSEGQPFAFERTAAGWVTHPLSPPSASFETDSLWSFNADSGNTVFSAPRVPPGVIEEDFYGRDEQGSIVNIGPVGEHADYTRTSIVESTGDLSHVLYERNNGSPWSFDPSHNTATYEYTAATGNVSPLLVGVSGGLNSHAPISTCGTALGGSTTMSREIGSLSEDGRTAYFTAEGHSAGPNCPSSVPAPAAYELYARVDGERGPPEGAHSVLVSGPTPAACTSEECHKDTTEEANARDANFEAASADGSRALFTDTQQLTDNASEDPNIESSAGAGCSGGIDNIPGTGGCNLYESVCAQPCGTPAEEPNASSRELIDVSETSGHAQVEHGPRVQGLLASSADGSHVYFIAKGVLTGAEQNQSHEAAEDGKENLYVYAEGHVAFVARLAPSDKPEWQEGGIANVTPSGRFLVFTSHRSLTADATCAEGEGEAAVCPAQVYEYDAQTRGLVRISVGEKGFNDNGNDGVLGAPFPTNPSVRFGDARIAERVREGRSVARRLDPTMSDDGAFVFFQSPVALTPGALNDVPVGEQFAQNVYEYHEGHVSLISDGKDTTLQSGIGTVSPVELLGSDASGSNVFFTTFDQLVPEDTDTQRDIYDAHICSAAEPCPPPKSTPVPCEGEACYSQAARPPASQGPRGSQSFAGPGNLTPPSPPKAKTAAQIRAERLAKALKACHKVKNKAKRVKCERQARKQFGPSKKASRAERAKRAAQRRRSS